MRINLQPPKVAAPPRLTALEEKVLRMRYGLTGRSLTHLERATDNPRTAHELGLLEERLRVAASIQRLRR